MLTADAGMGKTTVLRRVFAQVHDPRRRCVLVSCPHDPDMLLALLAERFLSGSDQNPAGSPAGVRSNGPCGWRRFREFTW